MDDSKAKHPLAAKISVIWWAILFGANTSVVACAFLGYYGEPKLLWMLVAVISWLVALLMSISAFEVLRKNLKGGSAHDEEQNVL